MKLKPQLHHMSAGEWAILVTLSVLWGGSFFFAKIAVADIPPLTLTLGRVALLATAVADGRLAATIMLRRAK